MYIMQLCNWDTADILLKATIVAWGFNVVPVPERQPPLSLYRPASLQGVNISCIWMEDSRGPNRPCHTTPHDTV